MVDLATIRNRLSARTGNGTFGGTRLPPVIVDSTGIGDTPGPGNPGTGTGDGSGKDSGTVIPSGGGGSGKSPADVITAAGAAASTISQLKYPLEEVKYWMNLGIMEYSEIGSGSGTTAITSATFNTISNIRLPLPDAILDQQEVAYMQPSLLAETFKALAGIAGGAAAMAGGIGQSVGAGLFVGGVFQGIGTILRSQGIAPNLFITVLLEGPKYKQHQFKWTLSPRTPEEAYQVKEIIRLLNNSMAPGIGAGRVIGGVTFGRGYYWTFPKVFLLSFVPNPDYLFKFRPAVLTNFAVDYAGGHIPSFRRKSVASENQNAPQAVTLHMQFMEIEFWKAGDFVNIGPQTGPSGSGAPLFQPEIANDPNSGNIPRPGGT